MAKKTVKKQFDKKMKYIEVESKRQHVAEG